MRIFMLEDETMLKEAIAEFLTQNGNMVDTFSDSESAEAAIKTGVYDIFCLTSMCQSKVALNLLKR